MSKTEKQKIPETIEVPVYWNRGDGLCILRDGLPVNHPEHTYNYIKKKYGVDPERYGIYHPTYEQYKDYTHSELIAELKAKDEYIAELERLAQW